MKIYTVEQRKEVYKELLNMLYNDRNFRIGICSYLFVDFNIDTKTLNSGPELKSLKPKNAGDYWFPLNEEGRQQRIALIQKAIAMCDEQIKNKES